MVNLVPSNLNKFIEGEWKGRGVAGRGRDFEEPTSSTRATMKSCEIMRLSASGG